MTAMSCIISDVITPLGSAVAGAVVGSLVTYLLSRRREKAERTPYLLFEFSDLPEHENLGAVGVRNLQSVRWAAHESGGLKSLRRSDEGRCIQRRG
jgi:hypothetical protein